MVATIAAGSRQQSRFIALMENYDRTMELIDTAYDSAGRSSEQFSKYQDTLEYKIKQLQNTWEQFRTQFFNSEFFKNIVDGLNKILNLVKDFDLKQILSLGVIGITLGKSVITNFTNELQKGTHKIQSTWSKALQYTTSTGIKGFMKGAISKQLIQELKTFDSNKYLKGAGDILGSKRQDAPQMVQQVEVQKTQELQKQLQLYSELSQKRSELAQKAMIERQTDRQISSETLNQIRLAQQERTEKLKMLNDLSAELGYEQQITAQNANQLAQKMQEKSKNSSTLMAGVKTGIGNAASSALSAGITTALMTAISGADLTTVLKTAGVAALSAAIPAIISAIMPVIISVLTGPVGIVVAVVGVVALISHAVDEHYKKIKAAQIAAQRAELERIKNVEEINKRLREEQQNAVKGLRSTQKEKENVQNLQNRYAELSQKAFLNKNEQTEFSQIIETLTTDYDDLILSFDENTNKIEFNTSAIEKLNETLDKQEAYERAKIKSAGNQQVFNTSQTLDMQRSLAQDIVDDFSNYEIGYAIGGGSWADRFLNGNEYVKAITPKTYTRYNGTKYYYSNDTLKEVYQDEGYYAMPANDTFLSEPSEDMKFAVEQINILSDEIKKKLNLDTNHDYTPQEFSNWLIEQIDNGVYKSIEDFTTRIQNEVETFYNDPSNSTDVIVNAIKDSAKNQYKTYKVAGENIGEELANDLTAGIEKTTQDKINEAYDKYALVADEEGIFNATGSANFGNLVSRFKPEAGVTRDDVSMALKLLGFVTEDGTVNEEELDKVFGGTTKNFIDMFDELPEELRQAFIDIGYDKDELTKTWEAEGGNKDIKKLWGQVLQGYVASIKETFAEIPQEMLDRNENAITEYNKLQQKASTLTQGEYEKELDRIKSLIQDSDKLLADTFSKANSITVNATNQYAKNYAENIQQFSGLGIDENQYSKLNLIAQNAILDTVTDANLSDTSSKGFVKDLVSIYTSLKPVTQGILSSVDLINKSYSELLLASEEYIQGIADTGEYSIDEARKIYSEYIEKAFTYLTKAIYSKEGANLLREQYDEQLKSIPQTYKTLLDAQNEFEEKGILSSETYFSLLADGFGRYVKITDKGYELMSDYAEQAYADAAMTSLKSLRKQIEDQENLIKQAEKYSNSAYNDKIEAFLQLSEKEFDTERNKSDFKNLNTQVQDYILLIREAGYTTQTEFIKALKEGNLELKNMEPEVWIQGLVLISEQIKETENKIKDLKEELENLNEQLSEDQEALNKAEDALRQAIHGSDDFQSSLDGLINYTSKIERLDKAIEKTKTSLEDVSNIDEAKGLLSQLNEQYNDKTITLGAENIAIDKALNNLQSTLLQNYGNYISFDSEGNPLIDYAYMKMDANDEIRKAFEEEYNLYNEYRTKKEDNLDALDAIEKEREERQTEALNNFVSEQEKLISILKEKAQEEIDVTKEKYEALEEADNDYLDALEEAINKQRELRDRQNQYEDLATKEKKLALLQRDTSGANRKEAMSLTNEIEDDRQNLLDSEVDNLIDSMKELYEKQKEARDAEIEYMETVTDNAQYFADWASNIMASWQSVEDMQAWYLENDPEAQDMTVEQTEAYLNQIEESWSNLIEYAALSATDFTAQQEDLTNAMNLMYESTGNNIENLGTITQEIAQKAADDLISEATRARDDALDKMNETQKKIEETKQKLAEEEQNAANLHSAYMKQMVEASQSAIKEVSLFATRILVESSGIDFNNKNAVTKWARENKLALDTNEGTKFSQSIIDIMGEQGFDTSWMQSYAKLYQVYAGDGSHSFLQKTVSSEQEAKNAAKNYTNGYYVGESVYGAVTPINNTKTTDTHSYKVTFPPELGSSQPSYQFFKTKEQADAAKVTYDEEQKRKKSERRATVNKYKTGGIVDYTGPAWVDGTPMKPEAFLSADDTKRIGEAAKILANLPIFNSTTNAQNAVSTNVGDTTIEIHINVENIESDYDVDQMIERVKKDIVDVSKPTGTPVILRR